MAAEKSFLDVVDQFRPFDSAVRDWLRTAPLNKGGKMVPIVFAGPDGAFAAMEELLEESLGEDLAEKARNIPLPFMSIQRGGIQFDPERFHGASTMISGFLLGYSPDAKKSFRMKWPKPYDWSYKVEVWTKNRMTRNIFEGWMLQQFESFELLLEANFDRGSDNTDLIGRKLIPFENQGIVDNSDLEPEDGERILRYTLEMLCKGWIHGDITEVGTVLEIYSDIYTVEDSGIDLSTVTAAQVAANPDDFVLEGRITTDEDGSTQS
jgi:hypothetical protein